MPFHSQASNPGFVIRQGAEVDTVRCAQHVRIVFPFNWSRYYERIVSVAGCLPTVWSLCHCWYRFAYFAHLLCFSTHKRISTIKLTMRCTNKCFPFEADCFNNALQRQTQNDRNGLIDILQSRFEYNPWLLPQTPLMLVSGYNVRMDPLWHGHSNFNVRSFWYRRAEVINEGWSTRKNIIIPVRIVGWDNVRLSFF